MTPNVDDLQLFFAVAKGGTITAAARQLALPKSTVSRRLIQFEESLGIKLLHKTTRKITLTALGSSYLERCERVVHEIEEARSYLDSVTTKATGELRVTMPTDVGIHWLADFLVGFARRHPDVKLSLDFTGRRLDLIGERFDVALRAGTLTSSEAVARKLFSWTWQLYASPDYLRAAGAPQKMSDLAGHRFVVLEAYSRPRPEIDLVSGHKVERISMPGVVVSNSLGVLRAMLVAGGGIGLMPFRMAEEALNKRQLVRVLPAWASRPLDIFYVIPSRRLLPAKTRLFVEELIEHVRTQERAARLTARQFSATPTR
jgi:DNA-binding transcriptional LysR family regulator